MPVHCVGHLKALIILFELLFALSGCGGDIAAESGVITSPNYPLSFPAFSDCVWRLRAPADRYISLRFVEFTGINGTNSECSVDSVEVRDGYSRKARILGNDCDNTHFK